MTADNLCKVARVLPAINGKALANHTVALFRVANEDLCQIKCFIHNSCVSYNLGPQEGSGHLCEISDSDHIRDPQDMQKRSGFLYVAFEVRRKLISRPPSPERKTLVKSCGTKIMGAFSYPDPTQPTNK